MPRAPRRCPAPDCTELITGSARYCEAHTKAKAWQGETTGQGSSRATRAARDDCLRDAGYQCQLKHPGCTGYAREAHHAAGLAATGRRRSNAVDRGRLIAACPPCHGVETQAQARASRGRA
jgi:5-methylcytosine-specific restriction protein A